MQWKADCVAQMSLYTFHHVIYSMLSKQVAVCDAVIIPMNDNDTYLSQCNKTNLHLNM